MLNLPILRTQLETINTLLGILDLHNEREYAPRYENAQPRFLRNLSYSDLWLECYANRLYDFVLSDFSLLQFRVDPDNAAKFSYSYIDCPYEVIPYTNFVSEILGYDPNEVRDEFKDEYELEILSSPIKMAVTPIRYDYDPASYREGLHPASHMHFGFRNNIRIGTKRVLKPLSFTFFILRQYYHLKWPQVCNMVEMNMWGRNIRESLIEVKDVSPEYMNPKDSWEMVLD